MSKSIGDKEMKKYVPLAAILSLLLSCIEFEKQTMTLRYDKENDRLLIFQVYEGISGSGVDPLGGFFTVTLGKTKKDDEDKDADSVASLLTTKEVEQLRSVMEGERTFFFSNWIAEYNREALEESLAEDGIGGKKEKLTYKEIRAVSEARILIRLILDNTKVRNGEFYLNEEEKLSGYQFVAVENASCIVDQANRAISAALLGIEFLEADEMLKSMKDILITAASNNHEWIALDGNCITVRIPMPYEQFRMIKDDIVEDIPESCDRPDEGECAAVQTFSSISEVLQSDFWVSYVGETLEITIGHPSADRTRVALTCSGKYNPSALNYVSEVYGIAEEVDIEKTMDTFFE